MPSDDEFRKVAEDIGALARALGRDFRDAVDQARQGGHTTRGAVKEGLRGLSADARRNFRQHRPPGGWGHCPGWGRRGYWGGPPWIGPGDRPADGPGPVRPDGSPPWTPGPPWGHRSGYAGGPPWAGPPWNRPRHKRSPLPPVRRRWDATTLIGVLAVVFGLAWLVSAVGVIHLSVEGVVAVGLMLLGAALVVTGRTDWSLSRRSWPVWLGAGMIVLLVATSSTFGVGNTLGSVSFGSSSAMAPIAGGTIHGGFGNLTVNVPPNENGTLTVTSVAGRTAVALPDPPPTFTLNARVAGGEICVDGQDKSNGPGANVHQVVGSGNPTFTLDVHQMAGQIAIGAGC